MKKLSVFLCQAAAATLLLSCASTAKITSAKTSSDEDDESIYFPEELAAVRNPLPDGQIILLDSFEDGNFWQPLNDSKDTKALDTEVSSSWFSEGEAGGLWTFTRSSKNNRAVFYCDALSYRKWEDGRFIICDINNTSKSAVRIRLALETKSGTAFTEGVSIGTGDNRNIIFNIQKDLTGENGEAVEQILDPSNIRKLAFLIERSSDGSIFVDNIRLVK